MRSSRRSATPGVAILGIATSIGLGIFAAALRTANAEPAEASVEIAGNIAFGIVLAAPAFLGLPGLRRRPALFLAAGVLDLVFATLMLISLIGLIFVPPAVMFIIASREMRDDEVGPVRSIAAVLIALVFGVGGFFTLFARQNPVCWATNPATGQSVRLDPERFVHGSSISMDSRDLPPGFTESGCSSDSISNGEAAAAVVVVVVMLGLTWLSSRARTSDPADGATCPTVPHDLAVADTWTENLTAFPPG